MQFIDEAKIYIRSGDGGNGCVAFRREKFMPNGGPSGGNGGRGGDVILQCVSDINTLIDFRYKQHFKAQHGNDGKGQNCDGSAGKTIVIDIPKGTQVFSENGLDLIYDFQTEGETLILAKGGNGGFGNAYFKSSVNQAPKNANAGLQGEEMWIWIKLKLLSDAGLVGLPNAGKSTFLSRVTAAKPKIADYPFTTLKPQLGVVRTDDYEFVLADIPGLIEGAHLGVGLGCRFLKHIERCRTILHLIDINSCSPLADYKVIRNELDQYGLGEKAELVVLNKIDAKDEEECLAIKTELSGCIGKEVFLISAVTGAGLDAVLRKLHHCIFHENMVEK
jgi:GTP-binding protein